MTAFLPTSEMEQASDAHAHNGGGFVRRYFFSVDHKVIGIQFLFAGLTFFALGGLLAMLMRWQLAWPNDPMHPVPILGKWLGWDGGFMPAEMYNIILTMHATVMIFFVLIPLQVGAFGNYLIPLKIGARDMAFPIPEWIVILDVHSRPGQFCSPACVPAGRSGRNRLDQHIRQ